jgi:hypothetical protein
MAKQCAKKKLLSKKGGKPRVTPKKSMAKKANGNMKKY